MTKTTRWVLKNQLGWILCAGLLLIYTSAKADVLIDIHQGFRYQKVKPVVQATTQPVQTTAPAVVTPPQDDIVELEPAKPITFKPAPKPVAVKPAATKPAVQKPVVSPTEPYLPGPTDFFFGNHSNMINGTSAAPATIQPEDKPEPTNPVATQPAPAPAPKPGVSKPLPQVPEFYGSPIWGRSKDRDRWSRTVLEVVRANKRTLDRARDKEKFCPGYSKASQKSQEMCWLIILSAMTRYESNFNPSTSLVESNGDVSVGLLAMSGHQCRNAPTVRALKNPIENLKCGTRKLVSLIGDDSYISAGKSGGAANWSVLRSPYWATLANGRRVKVGKINQILALTKPAFKNTLKAESNYATKLRLAQDKNEAPQPTVPTQTTPRTAGGRS